MDKSLSAGFFQMRINGDDIWIQFKYECLVDFYYCCGKIDYVNGKCSLHRSTTLTNSNAIAANIYRQALVKIGRKG